LRTREQSLLYRHGSRCPKAVRSASATATRSCSARARKSACAAASSGFVLMAAIAPILRFAADVLGVQPGQYSTFADGSSCPYSGTGPRHSCGLTCSTGLRGPARGTARRQGRSIERVDFGDRHLDLQLRPLAQCLGHGAHLVRRRGIHLRRPGSKSMNCRSGPPPNKAPSRANGAVTAFSRMFTKTFQMMGHPNVGSSSEPATGMSGRSRRLCPAAARPPI